MGYLNWRDNEVQAKVCAEHKWTIVYLYERPVGVACENCSQAMAIDPNQTPPVDRNVPEISLTHNARVRLTHSALMGDYFVQDLTIRQEYNSPTRVSVEFVQDMPF